MRLICSLMVLVLAGCSTMNQQQMDSADYGEYPQNYEKIIKGYFNPKLRDPESAKYRITQPSMGWHKSISGAKFGYRSTVYINGKNAYGGYTGEMGWDILIRNGNVIIAIPKI